MKFSARISLIVALAFGAMAAFLVRGLIQTIGRGEQTLAPHTIVVAKSAITPGAPLGLDNLREVPWRATDTLEGGFETVADLVKDGRRLALVSFQRNEPILTSKVTAPNQRATLSTQLDEGMRAVSVRVDEVRGVAGFVLPGDRVDLILTRGENGGVDQTAFADLLLQYAKVLAVDQIAAEGQDKPTIARAVTLELTMQQAQKVVLAQGIGRISLVLRQANESGDSVASRVTANDLGASEPAERDRLADFERRLIEMKQASEAARSEAERQAAQRLSDVEARMRDELMRKSVSSPPAAPAASPPPRSVVTVIRNGSKSEQYSVAAEH